MASDDHEAPVFHLEEHRHHIDDPCYYHGHQYEVIVVKAPRETEHPVIVRCMKCKQRWRIHSEQAGETT